MTELTLGPVYYLWEGPKWRDFYYRIADEAPVDRIILGETVCSQRQHFIEPHLADVVERLERAAPMPVPRAGSRTIVTSSVAKNRTACQLGHSIASHSWCSMASRQCRIRANSCSAN
jgi:hypothetical protein